MSGPPLHAWMLLAAVLFCIGLFGVFTRKNLVAILLSVELMANAVNLNLVAVSRYGGHLLGQAFTLFAIALTVAEVAVGLAIVILLYRRHKDIDASNAELMRG